MSAAAKLAESVARRGSHLCLGLDPDPARLPQPLRARASVDPGGAVLAFCAELIAATSDVACAYKPNLAYFEALGRDGWRVLADVLALVPADIPTIVDAKRCDIGPTAARAAAGIFGELGADATTVVPWFGRDGIQPFVDWEDRMTFIVAASSNPSDIHLQDACGPDGEPAWGAVARLAAGLDGRPGSVGMVAGATVPARVAGCRRRAPDVWLLAPGVGAQGGDLVATVAAGRGPDDRLLITTSRSVTHAASDASHADAARQAAIALRDRIRAELARGGDDPPTSRADRSAAARPLLPVVGATQ